MGKLRALIADSTRGTSPVLQNYSESLPSTIAVQCGEEEVAELISFLDEVSVARENHDKGENSWDGDESDDLWRSQMRYASLLPYLIRRFPLEVAEGLGSSQGYTRFWIAYSFQKSPHRKALPHLKRALEIEDQKLNRETIQKALSACKWKAWLPFL